MPSDCPPSTASHYTLANIHVTSLRPLPPLPALHFPGLFSAAAVGALIAPGHQAGRGVLAVAAPGPGPDLAAPMEMAILEGGATEATVGGEQVGSGTRPG